MVSKQRGLPRDPWRLHSTAQRRDNVGMDTMLNNIMLNGESRELADNTTVQDLLETEGLADRRVAVEVNGEIVPRGRHAAHVLMVGDRVEIVHALGGG
jgi:sulfur carrier protein